MALDPRVRTLLFFCLLLLAMKSGFTAFLTGVIMLTTLLGIETHGYKRFWNSSKYFLMLVPLTFGFHLLMATDLFGAAQSISFIESVENAVFFTGRVGLLVSAGAYFTMSVDPASLTESLREFITPLGKIGLSIERILLVFLLTLSFAPIISEQATRIREAQIARGISMGSNLLSRISKMLPVMIPLFTLSISRAERLALILDSRGYNAPVKRTSLKKFKFGKSDYLVSILSSTITLLVIF
ncbi:MAG: energy-coupling factor transporter transmembrane protein EcfT [Candidatus Marinimicrobia bacterium]|nr:energy-coupling factor transporter transmembrane protein EcfT [Candidatus Neomarinimicrobiota bacterium]MCH7954575.1 energy-coupling factor transporter transmembrane protein EcfT [Candidatus Neomarinimicrobiota bacterium]